MNWEMAMFMDVFNKTRQPSVLRFFGLVNETSEHWN